MLKHVEKIIGSCKKPEATFCQYDQRAPEVAEYLKGRIESHLAEVTIEHIGSTAIPDCPGKGVIDLMALYPAKHLNDILDLLLTMGFKRQGKEFRNRYPDDRPGLMGTFEFDGTSFLVYIHIIHKESYEVKRFRIFRDILKNNSKLLSEYICEKKRIISEGATDTDDYSEMKQTIIRRILGENL